MTRSQLGAWAAVLGLLMIGSSQGCAAEEANTEDIVGGSGGSEIDGSAKGGAAGKAGGATGGAAGKAGGATGGAAGQAGGATGGAAGQAGGATGGAAG
ncbi:MAG TPA: hypothetical protein PLI95_04085, partial [Polyangiaceae bacterium]|nr:hypothetical protein [Polyangiaceae bacterium]